MSSKHASLMILLVLSFALMGCPSNNGGNGNGAEGEGQPEGGNTTQLPSFIDETVVLETSDWVTGTETADNEFTFDLSALSIVANRTFNEIEVWYTSGSTDDAAVDVRNLDTGEWDQVGFPQGAGGAAVTTRQNTLGDLLGDVQRYVDPSGAFLLMTSGAYAVPEVRVLRLVDNYRAVRPARLANSEGFVGLTYDGQHLWAADDSTHTIYLIDGEGAIASEFSGPIGDPRDMAFDGENVWLADGTGKIHKLSLDATLIDTFTVPTDSPGGLAWGDDSLWLADINIDNPRTFRIDPSASVTAGAAVVTAEFQTPGGPNVGLAWNGENLLILGDGLYVVNVDGTVINSYPTFPVFLPRGLAWDGQAIVTFSQGPPGVGNNSLKINWFRLR